MSNSSTIHAIAKRTVQAGTTLPAASLANALNACGVLSTKGKPYISHGRGIFSAIHAAYHEVCATQGQAEAEYIAKAFTKADGTYAYD